jgi:hypothetical protein
MSFWTTSPVFMPGWCCPIKFWISCLVAPLCFDVRAGVTSLVLNPGPLVYFKPPVGNKNVWKKKGFVDP